MLRGKQPSAPENTKLVVGLGNPGPEYAESRHNLGFMCLRHFARSQGIHLEKSEGMARTGSGEVCGFRVIAARPQTFMNNSGQSVSRLVNKYKIHLEDLIIIHDDLDLPLGKIRIRRGGGTGGHNGISSVADELVNPDFLRVRVGIGRPGLEEDRPDPADNDVIGYVLSDFSEKEKEIIAIALPLVSEAVLCLIDEGLTVAMNKYN